MCGLFIKRLINLTEEKIKENPFFFFIHSDHSHIDLLDLVFKFQILTSIYRKKIH